MLTPLLRIAFGQDHRFAALHGHGMPDAVRQAMQAFWARPEYAPLSSAGLDLAPADAPTLIASIEALGRRPGGRGEEALWVRVAEASADIAEDEPVAAALVALQALAAWTGALGEHLFVQPWSGHHRGWHLFPLNAARRLAAADAIDSARYLCEVAAGFVEAARDAPFDPVLRGVVAEYEDVLAAVDATRADAVAELAWELHAHCASTSDGFRAELAAMFWIVGDVPHAELLGPRGQLGYLPPYAMVRALVDHALRVLPSAPLLQSILLDMKDRGPFDLRRHAVLFGRINNVYRGHALHDVQRALPMDLCGSFARVLIGAMRGQVPDDDEDQLYLAMSLVSGMVQARAPAAYLQIASLATMLRAGRTSDADAGARWQSLAETSASILGDADTRGIFEAFDRTLDIPFHALSVATGDAAERTLDLVERSRQANLGYWLLIAPPTASEALPPGFDAEERVLLRELRGARFIRLLPHLPRHYRRYGFRIDEALAGPPSGGAPVQDGGLLQFDPFDQETAERYLGEVRERLARLHESLRSSAPRHAAMRSSPPSSAAEFITALGSHRESP
jgi:hypothetical protein